MDSIQLSCGTNKFTVISIGSKGAFSKSCNLNNEKIILSFIKRKTCKTEKSYAIIFAWKPGSLSGLGKSRMNNTKVRVMIPNYQKIAKLMKSSQHNMLLITTFLTSIHLVFTSGAARWSISAVFRFFL